MRLPKLTWPRFRSRRQEPNRTEVDELEGHIWLALYNQIVTAGFHVPLPEEGHSGLGAASGYIFGFASRVHQQANLGAGSKPAEQETTARLFDQLYGDPTGSRIYRLTTARDGPTPASPQVIEGLHAGLADADLWIEAIRSASRPPVGLIKILSRDPRSMWHGHESQLDEANPNHRPVVSGD